MSVNEIISLVYLGVLLIALVFCFVICAIYYFKCKESEKDYVSKLTEHDKSVILDYKVHINLPLSVVFYKKRNEKK